jgi:hypothetical protein
MSRHDVIRHIVEREVQGLGLTEEAVLAHAPDLHRAACAGFGTWDTALKYAGVRRRRRRAPQGFTPECLILKIRRYCRTASRLSARRVLRQHDRLYWAARRHFGTWRRALRAAGVDLERARLRATKPRPHNKPKILEAVRQWGASGHSLRWSVVCLENHALAWAAKNAFEGWRRALVAAGIVVGSNASPANRKWDQDRIIATIRTRQQEGKPLDYTAVRVEGKGLLCAAKRYLGSWQNALRAAGVAPQCRSAGRRRAE